MHTFNIIIYIKKKQQPYTDRHTPVKIIFFGLQEVHCVFDWFGHQNTDIESVLRREISAHPTRLQQNIKSNSTHMQDCISTKEHLITTFANVSSGKVKNPWICC